MENDPINMPKHYRKGKIETCDYIIDQKFDFLEGNICKYLSRWKDKNGVEDLKKLIWYANRLLASIERPEVKSADIFKPGPVSIKGDSHAPFKVEPGNIEVIPRFHEVTIKRKSKPKKIQKGEQK